MMEWEDRQDSAAALAVRREQRFRVILNFVCKKHPVRDIFL
jgi:hypothetical protein